MLRAIVRHSLRYPWLVVFAVLALGGAGVVSLLRADFDVFPNFAPPIVAVSTTVPGLAPGDVETLVTTPIEDAVDGVPGLAKMRSQSVAGLSVVTATFRGGTDLYRDRELVAERIATAASALPPGARSQLMPAQSATGTVLDVGLTSSRLSLMELTELTRAAIRPALLAVAGVANVVIFGAQPEQWQVRVEPKALLAAHVGLNQLIEAATAGSGIRRAGVIDTPNQRFLMQSHGQAADLAALGQTVIDRQAKTPLTLGDVAHLTVASRPPIGAALIGQKPGLLLIVSAQYGANTLQVADGLRRALHRLAPSLARAAVELDPHALQPATFIHEALRDLRNSLLIGAALILVVIVLALRDLRVALISFATIPFSLLLAILVLDAFGLTLDTFSLGGLAIALGIIVDDAIIDIENVRRRLHENRMKPEPAPRLRVILDASIEVRTPIIFATLSIVIVFLPIFALGGIAGRLFAPLAVAVIVAILASLLLALTLTPALAGLLLGPGGIGTEEPLFVRAVRQLHRKALAAVHRHARAAVAVFGTLALAALVSIVFLPTRFLPRFHENDVIAHFLAPPGTSLPQMLSLARHAVARLQQMPQVAEVVVHIGHANLGNGHADINKAELDITLSPSGNRDSVGSERAVLAALNGVPGVRFWANTFLTERIHEVLSGTTAPIVVHIFGRHFRAVDADAQSIAAALRRLPGAEAVTVAAPPETPSISATLRRQALLHYGLQPRTVLDAIEAGTSGRDVGRVYRDGASWPITVLLPKARRPDAAALGALPLIDGNSRIVPLGSLASLKEYDGRSVILHEDAQRIQNVTVQIAGGGASAFLARARKALDRLPLSPGTYLTFGGTATASNAARRVLLFAGLAALAAVLGLLTAALGRAWPALLLAFNLPFALMGGIAALWIAGLPLSLGAAVGLVTVFGITLRNGLMLLAHYRHLVLAEGLAWSPEAAERGAVERVVPVLLTAAVTALGLLPLAVGTGLPGQEIEGPMAIVILGGLVSSTPLTLLALPGLAARLLRPAHFIGPPEIV
ncbi:MAG TPA: efflux RND transporter permease subunit [Stellaceae bacterium]|nr:efflux RND transporter permease subunit [Stellaceae bacterium]